VGIIGQASFVIGVAEARESSSSPSGDSISPGGRSGLPTWIRRTERVRERRSRHGEDTGRRHRRLRAHRRPYPRLRRPPHEHRRTWTPSPLV